MKTRVIRRVGTIDCQTRKKPSLYVGGGRWYKDMISNENEDIDMIRAYLTVSKAASKSISSGALFNVPPFIL